MALDSAPTERPAPKVQRRLASGEAIFGRWPDTLEHGMLCRQLWLRGELGALRAEERPSGWDGEASWWLPGEDRHAGLVALLPDLMAWLPPQVDAPRKLQVAERMPFPEPVYRQGMWDQDDPAAPCPFVDAVFADGAAHLHLVDIAALGGGDAYHTFSAWQSDVRVRGLEKHWLRRNAPGSCFDAEYAKLCWLRRQSPTDGVCAVIDSRGDELPNRTVEAFWHWVGERCVAYWDEDLSYRERHDPHRILVTDGSVPPDEQLFDATPIGNFTLACVTPFVLDGATWLRVDARAWASALGEMLPLAPNRVCRMAGATDVGKRRAANQDAVLWSEEDGWAAVADGMGGHPQGDVASAEVVRVFDRAMRDWPNMQTPHRRRTVAQRLRHAAAEAHAELWKENDGRGIVHRMGTTLSALRLHGDELSLVHAGDSRIYEFAWDVYGREPELRQLTADHGERGGLDRALGLWERVPFDIDTVPLWDHAFYLLCSDGLTNMVYDAAIERICLKYMPKGGEDADLEGLVDALIAAANDAGGHDNITVCVVEARRPAGER